MKVPVAWILAAFCSGILLSRLYPAAISACGIAAATTIFGAFMLLRFRRLAPAALLTFLAWVALGALATGLEKASVPRNHVTRWAANSEQFTSEPLRWQGRVRSDPERFPWGLRYEISLEQVELQGRADSVSGGLRVNYFWRALDAPSPIEVHAGDRIEALVKAQQPRNFQDPGAFDARGMLARQGIHLVGALRDPALLVRIETPPLTLAERLARIRGVLLARLDALFPEHREELAVLRAMLLGDRGFVDSTVVEAFQKTATYHVLVLAGLHVAALTVFFLWVGRRLRLSLYVSTFLTVAALAAYVGVVQDRPPILRAALMAAIYLCARLFFRRVEVLNTIALAALILLFWKPSSVFDPSFQLSFLAVTAIGGLALPWIEGTSEPYLRGLRHIGDATRDAGHSPRVAQFRLDVRAGAHWLEEKLPRRAATYAPALLCVPLRAGLRLWELLVVSVAIQWGMTPLLALYFHRITLAGPFCNIPAVILLSFIVPLGFLTLVAGRLWVQAGALFARLLGWLTSGLLHTVFWFSRLPRVSYRIPGPPRWILIAFFVALAGLMFALRWNVPKSRQNQLARPKPLRAPATAWVAAGVLAALTLVVAVYPFPPQVRSGQLELTILDVGQGNSALTIFPNRKTLLIDGGGLSGSEAAGGYHAGPDVGEEVVAPYLWSRGLKKLDVVLMTHADRDHADGLRAILEDFPVKELWVGIDKARPAAQRLMEIAKTRGASAREIRQGFAFDWAGVAGRVLWPSDSPIATASHNDASVVLRLSDGNISWLLTGDIDQRVERELESENEPLKADFLEVPHHGSKSSSSDDFISAVAPQFAAVSVGAGNPFGHPNPAVMDRYAGHGVAPFLRTDLSGCITIRTDGRTMAVETFAQQASH